MSKTFKMPKWQYNCSTAEEFLDHVSPWGPVFQKHQIGHPGVPWMTENTWVFRGQFDAEWKLEPLALRSPHLIHPQMVRSDGTTKHTWHASEAKTQSDIFLAELRTINEFYRHSNCGGSTLPEDTSQTQDIIEHWIERLSFTARLKAAASSDEEFFWPPIELASLFGIAQHYGIPTQLLDWSRNPYKAAFFSLEKFVRKSLWPVNPRRRLAVWAVKMSEAKRAASIRQRIKEINDFDFENEIGYSANLDFSDALRPVGANRFRIIEVPTAPNKNLRAQEGVFLARRFIHPNGQHPFDLDGEPDLSPFDVAFSELRQDAAYLRLNLSPAYKFTLPQIEAPKLFTLLRHVGVSSATLYPSFEGAKWAYDEDLWLAKASKVSIRLSGGPKESQTKIES